MSPADAWRARWRTGKAVAAVCLARAVVAALPFTMWRGHLGSGPLSQPDPVAARRLAAHVERAALRLPFKVKCLPQALALSWQLRRRAIEHRVVLAVRPPGARGTGDDLHAWVECAGAIILGEQPGPWVRVLTLPPK